MKIFYQAIDGKQFETEDECLCYEYSKLRFKPLYFDGQKIVEDKDVLKFSGVDNPIAAQIEVARAIEFKNKKSYDEIKKYCEMEDVEFPERYGSGIWTWNGIEWIDVATIEKHLEFETREINAWKEYLKN